MPAFSSALSYIVINIDPVFNIGPLGIHWYGVAYVVGISIALWAILRYTRRLGLDSEIVYKVFWWAALGGLVGGRLYFVIQQPDLVDNYLKNPINIIAVWNGGMAFFGAIFLGIATVAFVAWRKKLPIWLALDIAAFFAAVGQIFGRFGNLVNGDILGYQAGTLPPTAPDTCLNNAPCLGIVSDPHILPWATVYANPHSFAPLLTPFQPAAAYEMLMNIVLLAILFPLLLRLPRIKMGLVSLIYLAGYAISQIVVFFFRGSEPITPFLGIPVFKQAQWTGIFVLVLLIPYYFLMQRTSHAWTREEARAVNAALARTTPRPAAASESEPDEAALATAGAGSVSSEEQQVDEEHEGHAHQEHTHHSDEEHERPEEDAHQHHAGHPHEGAPEAEATSATLAEQGVITEYDEALAAELRTEGIEVASPQEQAAEQAAAAEGEQAPGRKPRSRTGSNGARGARAGRSSAKKSAED
jgi:phosphatidylglycerol:prolipoprotein diacylglycerol transferase